MHRAKLAIEARKSKPDLSISSPDSAVMSTQTTLIILNPRAKSERAGDYFERIINLNGSFRVKSTGGPGEARLLAKQAVREGFKRVVVAGGDGTVNEVVNGLAGSEVELGLLPIGTMNVFATELGIPTNNVQKCWDIIQAGHVVETDLSQANGHYFVQLAGVGFDARVVQETPSEFKNALGPLGYLIVAAQVAGRKPPKLLVEANGETREGSFVLVGNGRYYGGPFVLFKEAKINDGLLDILIFKNWGFLDIARYLNGIVFGHHHTLPDVEYFQTARMNVSSEEIVPVEVDGEVIGNLPVTFSVAEKKLKVLAPL